MHNMGLLDDPKALYKGDISYIVMYKLRDSSTTGIEL